jgi:hypothetical protein
VRHLVVTDSDIIDLIGFEWPGSNDGLLGTMEIVFKATPDVVYRYSAVDPDTFVRLISAESIGKAFHERFKKTKHPFTKSIRPTLKK